MVFHVRMRRWVLWWFCIGVACGVVAVVNILGRNLSQTQEDVILVIGAMHWLLGGLVCYACDAIRIQAAPQQPKDQEAPRAWQPTEWHPASDFLFAGNRQSLLPPRY